EAEPGQAREKPGRARRPRHSLTAEREPAGEGRAAALQSRWHGGAGHAEAGPIAAERGRDGERLVANSGHGDRPGPGPGDGDGLAVLDGRPVAELHRPEVIERRHATPAAGRLFHPFGRRPGRGVVLRLLVRLAGRVVGERDLPGAGP